MIESVTEIRHASLPGVAVIPLDRDARRGEEQRVLVRMDPGAVIPLHSHKVEAVMHPVAGNAIVLSDDDDDGTSVRPGTRVRFQAEGRHGFQAGDEGFSFVSVNGGIVDEDGDWDISFD